MNDCKNKFDLALNQPKFLSNFDAMSTTDIKVPILVHQHFFRVRRIF